MTLAAAILEAESTQSLRAARRLLASGLSVIPVPRPNDRGSDGKRPAIEWREFQTRLPSDAELVRWFGREPMNIAIVTGAVSGVVVIDADSIEAARWLVRVRCLPLTPWRTRTARGWHCFYQHPGDRVVNRARIDTGAGKLAIDVRGDGGFVIAPGSIHASSVRYEQAGDWSVPRKQLPAFDPAWLAPPQRASGVSKPRRPHAPDDLLLRGRAYLNACPKPEIGQGSDAATLYAACRLVRGFCISPADAAVLLWEWAGNRPGWSFEWIARKVEHAELYGTEPIGALR